MNTNVTIPKVFMQVWKDLGLGEQWWEDLENNELI